MRYYDTLILCPNGLVPVLQEIAPIQNGKYLRYDEEGNIEGINTGLIHILAPRVPTAYEPDVIYCRGYKEHFDAIQYDGEEFRTLINFEILAMVEVGNQINVGTEEEPIMQYHGVYEALKADDVALAKYMAIIHHPELLEDGTPNPKLIETIEVDDGTGVLVTIDNPAYDPFRLVGNIA